MLTDYIDISTQSKEQPSNYSYFVYNFPPTSLMEFQNTSIPQLQMSNSTDSVFKDNIQIPSFMQGLSVPSFQFNNSNQFCINEQKLQYISPVSSALASYFNEQSTFKVKQESKKNRIIVGTQVLCDIELILIQRYFDIKTQLFCPPNIKYTLNENKGISNISWLQDRIKNRYKKPIKDSMFDLINVIGNKNEQDLRQFICFQQFSSQGFDNLEKQVLSILFQDIFIIINLIQLSSIILKESNQQIELVIPKSIKQEKPFSEMMFEIQILIVQFLLTKF